MKLFRNLFFFVALIVTASCNDGYELIDMDTHVPLSRSVSDSLEYYIDGADELYTASPECYTVLAKNGPVSENITVEWEYSSDLQIIGGGDRFITLARKYAEGTYMLTANLSNGKSIHKMITAINAYKPTCASNTLSDASSLKLVLKYIGTSSGSWNNIEDYSLSSKKYLYTSGDIYVRATLYNESSSTVDLISSYLMVAYGYHQSPYVSPSINWEAYGNAEIIHLESGWSTNLVYKIPSNWVYNLNQSSDGYDYIDFYFVYKGQQLCNGSYCIALK